MSSNEEGGIHMFGERITSFEQAETVLEKATGYRFPHEENWILHAIAEKFSYKLSVILAKVLFSSRTGYQGGQNGFDSHLGRPSPHPYFQNAASLCDRACSGAFTKIKS